MCGGKAQRHGEQSYLSRAQRLSREGKRPSISAAGTLHPRPCAVSMSWSHLADALNDGRSWETSLRRQALAVRSGRTGARGRGTHSTKFLLTLGVVLLGALAVFGCVSDPHAALHKKALLFRAPDKYSDYLGEDAAVLLFRITETRSSSFFSTGICIAVDGRYVFADDSLMLGPCNDSAICPSPGRHLLQWQAQLHSGNIANIQEAGAIHQELLEVLPRSECLFVLEVSHSEVRWAVGETGRDTLKGKGREAAVVLAKGLAGAREADFLEPAGRKALGSFVPAGPTSAVVFCQALERGDPALKRGAIRALGMMGMKAEFAYARMLRAADASNRDLPYALAWALSSLDARGTYDSCQLLGHRYRTGDAMPQSIEAALDPKPGT